MQSELPVDLQLQHHKEKSGKGAQVRNKEPAQSPEKPALAQGLPVGNEQSSAAHNQEPFSPVLGPGTVQEESLLCL